MSMPIYKEVYEDLKRSIKNGEYVPGAFLPTEKNLMLHYNVSRTTIRKSLSLLANDSFITVKQGAGAEVLNYTATQRLNKVSSFTETLSKKGYKVTTNGMSISLVDAPSFVQKPLNIGAKDEVYFVQRVQCIDNEPISIVENYLVAEMFPELEQYTNTFTSLYQFLEEHYSLVISNAYERISASLTTFIESQILHVRPNSPLLISKRVTYTADTPFEYAKLKVPADKYEYSIHLQSRD